MTLSRLHTAPLAAPLVLLLAGVAVAFIDTHLDEISVPVDDSAAERIAVLEGLGDPTKAQKKELKQLTKLRTKLAKPARKLANDFNELKLAAKTAKKLREAGAELADGLEEAEDLALLALDERQEFVEAHLELLEPGRRRDQVQKFLEKYLSDRAAAETETDPTRRAKFLGKAEKDLTKALKKAEKFVLKAGLTLPLIRLRSGDRVGAQGARIVVRDPDSPLFGAYVEIPSGALRTVSEVSLTDGNSVVEDPDSPAGPSMAVLPGSLEFEKDVTVAVPFTLQQGRDDDLLGVFDAQGVSLDISRSGGLIRRTSARGGDFQAGYFAPPPGTPSGLFRVVFLTQVTNSDPSDADRNITLTEVTRQDFRFRVDGSLTLPFGETTQLSRTFLSDDATVPHHFDFANGRSPRTGQFAWTSDAEGEFSFGIDDPSVGVTIEFDARLTDDGDVFVFQGHGGPFDVIGVGVRPGADLGAADLAGRWAYVETGLDLLQPDSEPFTTRRRTASGTMVGDELGVLTFDTGGNSFVTDRTFDTGGSPIGQSRSTARLAEGGTLDLNVLFDGSVRNDDFLATGQLAADGQVLLLSRRSETGASTSLLVAVRQPSPAVGNPFSGTFETVSAGVGVEIDGGDATLGSTVVDVATGRLAIADASNATYTTDDGTRSTYTLDMGGTPDLISWVGGVASAALPGAVQALTLELDGDGNHRLAQGSHWFSVSGDGRLLLGVTPGTSEFETRTMILGVK